MTLENEMETVLNIREILKCLPHRYPFILVDRICELVREESIVALKNVTINEPFFPGHFPAEPIMPGVLIIEAMAQAGGILLFKSLPELKPGAVVYFMSMNNVKFRKPVVPGDQLIMKVRFLKKKLNVAKMAGTAFVDDTAVAQAELMANFGDAS
jgi:3-hydroxyacyl-[acyl-carrier-protein] dehydratase